MIVYADVTQTGAIGDSASGGTGWPVFSAADGRILSGTSNTKEDVFNNFPANSVSAAGFGPGALKDLDGDGDIDNGDTDANAANPGGWIRYRAAGLNGENGANSTVSQTSSTSLYANDAAPDGSIPVPHAIPGGFEYYLGEVDFLLTQVGDIEFFRPAGITWQFRPQGGSAIWYENATRHVTVASGKSRVTYSGGTQGTDFNVGAPVQIGLPEPSTIGFTGLGSLMILARRKR